MIVVRYIAATVKLEYKSNAKVLPTGTGKKTRSTRRLHYFTVAYRVCVNLLYITPHMNRFNFR